MAVVLTGSEYIDLNAVGAGVDIRTRPLSFGLRFVADFPAAPEAMIAFVHGRETPPSTAGEYGFVQFDQQIVRARIRDSNGNQIEVAIPDVPPNVENNMLIVARSNAIEAYWDGAQVYSQVLNPPAAMADINDLTAIGADPAGPGGRFIGEISHVAVWDTDLSPADAMALTAGTILPGDLPDGLRAWWPLDYNARDASGNQLNGVPVGDPTFTEDPPPGPPPGQIAQLVLSCLEDAYDGRPDPPGQICLRVGQVPFSAGLAEDLCCTGLAWVRINRIYPSTVFPTEQTSVDGPCPVASWAVELELGVIRCLPDHGAESGASCDEWTAAFLQVDDDAAAMREAVCCATSMLATNPLFSNLNLPGTWTPIDGQGGCIGGTMLATFGYDCSDC